MKGTHNMATALTFLKNYHKFAFRIRMDTARIYLSTMQQSQDPQIKKMMMLRITEELMNSIEDLTMWLSAYANRHTYASINKADDVWEYLLLCHANNDYVKANLENFAQAKSVSELEKKLDFSVAELSGFANLDSDIIKVLFEKLLETVRGAQFNRTVSDGVLLRFQNKVKHGMMILDEGKKLYIRDLQIIEKCKHNRNLELPIEIDRARLMVETIESNCYAVKNIITLFLQHYSKILKGSKFPLSKEETKFWNESLNYTFEYSST